MEIALMGKLCMKSAPDSEQRQNLESRAEKRALHKDPHLRSSPILGEGKKRGAVVQKVF
jgi:hypothetical protein